MSDIDALAGTDSVTACLDSVYNDLVEINAEVQALTAGNVAWTYVDKTASYVIVASTDTYGTKVFTNNGATGTITLSLPAGAASMRVSFNVVDAYTLKISANGAETIRHAGTQTAAGGYLQSATVGDFITLEWNGTEWVVAEIEGNNWTDGTTTLNLASALPKNYITGLTLSNDTDTAHDIAIAVGECRDAADSADLALSAVLTKQIDATWAAGDDAGGMFTGTVANSTWYHVHLIKKDSDGTIDAGYDTSITAANIPAGYTAYRRIGSVLTDGSANILNFIQIDEMFYWKDPPLDVNAVATGTALQTKTLSVPPDVNVMVHFNFARATGTGLMYFKTPGVNDEAPSATAAPLGIWVTADNTYLHPPVMTNTSKQITSRASTDQNLYLATLGWQDFRGRNG